MSDVFYQNQILDSPLCWPFQLFCFNFGATHILHHYGLCPLPTTHLCCASALDLCVALYCVV
jgi:hypothetical protein